jgi:Lrp/AsnC family leucine-responsive transcriptional regulator
MGAPASATRPSPTVSLSAAVMEAGQAAGGVRAHPRLAAVLDRARVGFPITAFIAVRYPSSTGALDEAGLGELAANPNVLECHHVAGEDCYMLKVAAPSIDSLGSILRGLREPGQPVSTRTTIVLCTLFEKPGIAPAEPD